MIVLVIQKSPQNFKSEMDLMPTSFLAILYLIELFENISLHQNALLQMQIKAA